jgi:hypothetical protein
VRQFLDIGTGLPTMLNTHEVAQAIAPDCRVVYVDNDPVVLAHARALLTNTTPEGVTTYVEADVHDVETIISDARNVLNFNEPIAVMFLGILFTGLEMVEPGLVPVERWHPDDTEGEEHTGDHGGLARKP